MRSLRRADPYTVDRAGKEIIRNELVESFHLIVGNVEKYHPFMQYGARPEKFNRLQVLGVELLFRKAFRMCGSLGQFR